MRRVKCDRCGKIGYSASSNIPCGCGGRYMEIISRKYSRLRDMNFSNLRRVRILPI